MHVLAVAGSSANDPGAWAYLAILAATVAGYMGVPFIGTAAIGAAAVFASQGRLNITAVLIVAVIGNEVGGLLGYQIGDRWGRRILEHPGPALEWRKKTLAKGETIYQKWVFVLAVGPAAYGAGRVASGHHDLVSVGMLVGGVAVGALCVVLGVRHHRRHRAAPGNHPGSRPSGTSPAQERS